MHNLMILLVGNQIKIDSDIIFPNLGIEIENLNEVAFSVFGQPVYWYGIIISMGIIAGLYMAIFNAKRDRQDYEIYYELLFYGLIAGIVGARLYYVFLEWDSYKGDLVQIINLRNGGLAIYGGVITAIIATIIFSRVKKLNYWMLLDTAATGMLIGQTIGRWGNFMNKEAFGGYTDNLFAMAIKASEASHRPIDAILINGTEYLQVHPTFLYESVWNLCV